ncbi:thioesterase domain-containing protein, partial [Mycobacterium sp. PSTR-4-N]|uniref:thioesterase domain-containing protein n=1 Tax=Mycobacterium sp. PSTR-4-N TaxID=2917745 RepID=UPI001F15266D
DDQIKLRGIRIEPTDIETTLTTHPTITTTRVIVHNQRLIAYYLSDAPEPADADTLRAFAARALPSHMVPAAFIRLDAFPLTPSGKLDKNALPEPVLSASAGRPPSTERQRRLCELFTDILGTPVDSVDADFFELGGHSLLLVRLTSVLRREFAGAADRVSVADLMVASTVAAVDDLLSGHSGGGARSFAPALPLRTTGTAAPLFCLPPASGLGWPYAALKHVLPSDVPLYALQSALFSGGQLPDDLASLASDYADIVEQIAPDGPVRLLGWSFGGVLALLAAQELRRRGRLIGMVAMLDSYPEVTEAGRVHDRDAVLARVLAEMGFPVDPEDRLTVEQAVELMKEQGDAITVLDDRHVAVAIENYIAAERFTADADYGHYDGDVFFVDAAEEVAQWGTASPAWRRYIGGELTAVSVPFRHSDLLDIAALEEYGPALVAMLTRGDGS